MDPNSGRLYESVESARQAGVENPVEIIGNEADVLRISRAVAAAAKKERKAQKKARRNNRG